MGFCTLGLIAVNVVLRSLSGTLEMEKINMWDMQFSYDEYGLLYSLFLETQYVKAQKPDNYSLEKVKQIADNYYVETNSSIVPPENLIVIMNESFADLEAIGDVKTNSELLPFTKSLTENTIKGYLSVPVFGAFTPDTEYEVLTGNSKHFQPSGTIAYQLYCHTPEFGMASNLKQQGYHTIAIHPYAAKNYNRDMVYNQMGFEEFISLENWNDEIEWIRAWPSDKTAYEKVIKLVQENEKSFIFLVTMQNHGGYVEAANGDYVPDVKLNYTQQYPLAETYFSLINESDQAFEDLISYFAEEEESTMIVMFGDHQPAIEEEFYEELFSKKLSDLSIEETQKRYIVPYLIWTNYEQESLRDQNMSANYLGSYIQQVAGIELTNYNQFLLKLHEELPILGIGGVWDNKGDLYTWDNLPEHYSERLEQYEILEYNNVFDYKNRITSVFNIN